MSTTIPYSPSLVLGSIVEPAAMENLLAISAAQTPIDAAQETLNSFISMKRSLEMTVQELINMGLDPKDLVKKVQEVGTDVDKAATAYATVRLEQELKLQPLRAKMQIVNASVESPIDYNRTQIKALPLAADSLKMDAQFFTFDDNAENDSDTLSNIKSYVSAATSFLGQGVSFDMAKTAVNQVEKQRQMHKISGTLVLTATCTHKEAQVLTPFYLDVDKAIRVWNQLFPGAKDKIRMDETTLRQIAETEGSTTEKSFNIISGASLGSSFVGMVHVLNTEDTTTSQDDESRAKDMKATLSLGSAIASLKGGFGVDNSLMTAFDNYVDAARKGGIGVPINYYLKPITRTQLAQMWMSKYYPDKFLAIQGDDSAAAANAPQQ
ncbi:MAG: hypothetical protein C0449_08915 [Polaromonas sp.]|nr:hypothetical protein [Polaromonas sp.]